MRILSDNPGDFSKSETVLKDVVLGADARELLSEFRESRRRRLEGDELPILSGVSGLKMPHNGAAPKSSYASPYLKKEDDGQEVGSGQEKLPAEPSLSPYLYTPAEQSNSEKNTDSSIFDRDEDHKTERRKLAPEKSAKTQSQVAKEVLRTANDDGGQPGRQPAVIKKIANSIFFDEEAPERSLSPAEKQKGKRISLDDLEQEVESMHSRLVALGIAESQLSFSLTN